MTNLCYSFLFVSLRHDGSFSSVSRRESLPEILVHCLEAFQDPVQTKAKAFHDELKIIMFSNGCVLRVFQYQKCSGT